MGSAASDAKRITQNFPALYVVTSDCDQSDAVIDELCLIVEKQIKWKLFTHKKNSDSKYYHNNRSSRREPCNQHDIDFITDNFFTVCPYRPQEAEYKIKCKDWIHVTYHLFDLFEEYSPFKMTHKIQNEWIHEVFVCASHLSYDMDLYCCRLIDMMLKCWGNKTFTKYVFNEELVELKSFYILNHCANKKQYLKSFKTTPNNIKTFIYKMIENIPLDPAKNRGNVCMKLIEFFMNKKRLRSHLQHNHKAIKPKLTYFDILKHVLLRVRILNQCKNDDFSKKYHKYHKYSEYVKVESFISELNVLLAKLKEYIIEHKLLEKHEFSQIIHDEILLSCKTNTKKQRKLFSETETLEYIKMIVEMRPASLFTLNGFKNGNKTALDLAKRNDLRKIALFLETAMKQNKYVLNENKHSMPPISNPSSQSTFNDELFNNLPHTNSVSHKSKSKHAKISQDKVTEYTESDISGHLVDIESALKLNVNRRQTTTTHTANISNIFSRAQMQPHKANRKAHDYAKSAILPGFRRLFDNGDHYHSVPAQASPALKVPYIDYHMHPHPHNDAPNEPTVNQWDAVDFICKMQEDGILEQRSPKSPYYVVDDSTVDAYSQFNEIVLKKKGIKNTQSIVDIPSKYPSQRNTSDLESRIKALETENVALKSDVRFLRKAMYDLTNSVQIIMQTIKP